MQQKLEWVILIFSLIFLILLYKASLMELLKIVLQWIFAATAFTLLIDKGIKKKR